MYSVDRLIMLGTGSGIAQNLYNTCFILDNGNDNILIDTGGGIEIVKRLEMAGDGYLIVTQTIC